MLARSQEAALGVTNSANTPKLAILFTALFALALFVPAGNTVSSAALCIVLFSALFSSIAGFAFSPIAGAMLFHMVHTPLAVVQILLVASIAQQIYCIWRLRGTIRMSECVPYLMGSVATLPLGLYLLLETPVSRYLPLLGVLLVVYGVFTMLRPALRVGSNPLWGRACAGALGGITGGVAASPAAFVTMWCHCQGLDKQEARSVIQPFILVNQLLTLGALMTIRPMTLMSLDGLRYAAPAVLGAYFGLMIFKRVNTSTFNRIMGLFLLFAEPSKTRVRPACISGRCRGKRRHDKTYCRRCVCRSRGR